MEVRLGSESAHLKHGLRNSETDTMSCPSLFMLTRIWLRLECQGWFGPMQKSKFVGGIYAELSMSVYQKLSSQPHLTVRHEQPKNSPLLISPLFPLGSVTPKNMKVVMTMTSPHMGVQPLQPPRPHALILHILQPSQPTTSSPSVLQDTCNQVMGSSTSKPPIMIGHVRKGNQPAMAPAIFKAVGSSMCHHLDLPGDTVFQLPNTCFIIISAL